MSVIVKSGVPGKVPTSAQLDYGQLALNYADQKMYFKNSSNQIVTWKPPTVGNFTTSPSSSVLAADIRNLTNPTSGLGYAKGVRFRFSALNDDNTFPYADVIDLTTYGDSTGGGFNALYFGKSSQIIQHKYAAAGATSWTTKTLAYTDSVLDAVQTNEVSNSIKTVEKMYNRGGTATNNVQIDISGGVDASTFLVEIDLGAYLGKYAKYVHHVYKANTWTDYGPSILQSSLSSGVVMTYSGSAGGAGVLRYTLSGLASAQMILLRVKVMVSVPGSTAPQPIITVSYP